MKIAIVTAMWKRPHIFDLFAINTNKLIKECTEHEIQVFVAGSEGDVSAKQCKEYGFNYIEHPNKPLYAKFNAAVNSTKEWQPDYLLMMGSDDIMDIKMLQNYYPHMRRRIDMIGTLDWCFYDLASELAYHWRGYVDSWNRGKTCGAGRMMSRKLLDALDWQPWQVQVMGEGMDGTMERRLKGIPHTRKSIRMGNGIGLGINSETQITDKRKIKNVHSVSTKMMGERFILPKWWNYY